MLTICIFSLAHFIIKSNLIYVAFDTRTIRNEPAVHGLNCRYSFFFVNAYRSFGRTPNIWQLESSGSGSSVTLSALGRRNVPHINSNTIHALLVLAYGTCDRCTRVRMRACLCAHVCSGCGCASIVVIAAAPRLETCPRHAHSNWGHSYNNNCLRWASAIFWRSRSALPGRHSELQRARRQLNFVPAGRQGGVSDLQELLIVWWRRKHASHCSSRKCVC